MFSSAIDNPFLQKTVSAALVFALWAFLLWRVIVVFGPDSAYTCFNSDGAIPILMANDERPITVFDFYAYGQDRWGAWPFLLARLVHHATNYRWSDQSMHYLRTIWLFLGVLVMVLLNRRAQFAVTLSCLIVISLQGITRFHLFDLSELYAWQIPSLLFAWYSSRRLLAADLSRSKRKASGMIALWSFLLLTFSFLAIWTSFASGPFLCFLVSLETLRANLGVEKKPLSSWIKGRALLGLVLVIAAILAEVLLRMNYHRHSLKHYGTDFKTPMQLDLGHLTENLDSQLHRYIYFSWWPFTLLPLLALLALAGAFVYLSWKKKTATRKGLRKILIDDTSILIMGSWGIAAINFALTILVEHVRLNLYSDRYNTLTFIFGSIGGLLTIFFIIRLAAAELRIGSYAIATLLIAGIALLTLGFPAQRYSTDYRRDKETALSLVQRAPNAILMGGYWQTYVFAGLQRTNTMIPLPLEGQWVRTPWTLQTMRQAREVVVEYRHSNFVRSGPLPSTLTQYGNTLRLLDPTWYDNGDYAFALYSNATK